MFDRVAVVGAGQMGARISWAVARSGRSVTLIDVDLDALARARSLHETFSGNAAPPSMATATDLDAACDSELVIEAITEQVPAKQKLFSALEGIVGPGVALATNSSSIPISQIETALQRPERVLNMHFYMTLVSSPTIVELMAGNHTDPDIISRSEAFIRDIGLTPLVVQKESVGFIFNRIWRAIKRECMTIVDTGVSSVEDVDRAWMIMYKAQSGPFGRMDSVGLDVTLDIERIYQAASGKAEDEPPKYLVDMVQAGNLGRKTGRGFYQYPNPSYEAPDFIRRARE